MEVDSMVDCTRGRVLAGGAIKKLKLLVEVVRQSRLP